MKKLILLTIVLVLALTASIQAAPRGMEWGWSMADVESVERELDSFHVETEEGVMTFGGVFGGYESLIIYQFSEGLQTVIIRPLGDNYKDDVTAFADFYDSVTTKYGDAVEVDSDLHPAGEGLDFAPALLMGYLDIAFFWDAPDARIGLAALGSDELVLLAYSEPGTGLEEF